MSTNSFHRSPWFLPRFPFSPSLFFYDIYDLSGHRCTHVGTDFSDRQSVEDVEYIDVTPGIPITDPARILAEASQIPFWVEDRRRESVHNRIFGLYKDIRILLDEFRDLLYGHCTPNRPRAQWERKASRTISESFEALAGAIESDLDLFMKVASIPSWDMWDYHGLNDEEYSKAEAAYKRESELNRIRSAFEEDFKVLTRPGYKPYDDLPF